MSHGLRALVALVWVLAATSVIGQQPRNQPIPIIDDPELEARYQALIHEVRCLVCENRSIAESPSDVAADLKKRIHDMIVEGKSDAEIAAFLAARYGDSILYRPPLQPNTWLLWGAPAVLLLLGAFVFARIVRARAAQPIEEDEPE
jgi:cytochrome c-type biogenesis protein CcmH